MGRAHTQQSPISKMRIGLFFGSFNPIHLGHTNIAQTLIKQGTVDHVLFIPSPQSPVKPKSQLAPALCRYEMVRLAIQDMPLCSVSDIEFQLPQPNYTIDTLHELKKVYPNDHLFLLIGEDNFHSFHRWKAYTHILQMCTLLVYPRKKGAFVAPHWLQEEHHILYSSGSSLFTISSTDIRSRIRKGLSLPDDLLDPCVYEYIKSHTLYLH